jgi:hypothetical protein
MIYLTTFILTFLLTQIAPALPEARGDPISPESLSPDPYGDAEYNFHIPSPLHATYNNTFDDPQGSLKNVACSDGEHGLAARYPKFGDLPNFPFISGAFDIEWNSPNCGACWQVTNQANGASFFLTAIDTAGAGFNTSEIAFKLLNGGQLGGPSVLEVVAQKVNPAICGI